MLTLRLTRLFPFSERGLWLTLYLMILYGPAQAKMLEPSAHAFFDQRQDTTQTAYVAVLGDYGLKRHYYEKIDSSGRAELKRLMDYVGSKATICMNYEFLRPGQIDFDVELFHQMGVDAISMTNNHSGDQPESFYREVRDRLDEEGFGTYGFDDDPYYTMMIKGQHLNILAACGNIEIPFEMPLSIHDEIFPTINREFHHLPGAHLFYAHMGGFLYEIDATDRKLVEQYLTPGTDVFILGGSHWTKGFYHREDRLAVVSPGDFLFPDSPRCNGVTLSTIPIFGFESEELVYYEVVVFDSKMDGTFKLANTAMRDSMVTRMDRLSNMTLKEVMIQPGTSRMIMDRFALLLQPKFLLKIRPYHVRLVWALVISKVGWPGVLFTLLVMSAALVFLVRFIRKRLLLRKERNMLT